MNILFDIKSDDAFTCVICDFGFSNLIEEKDSQKAAFGLKIPTTVGISIRYAAPEVCLFRYVKDYVMILLDVFQN